MLLNELDPEDEIVEFSPTIKSDEEAAAGGDEVSPTKAARQGTSGPGGKAGKPTGGLGNALKLGGK